ncbi:hypothetical protein [Vibrio lentus]|uniref:hypothetical protein n=1 Tax=Vibrio lentus TaxID=136468 RepID=UPI000976E67B|nr:hypothetical protein [Vibrio lentus]OMO22303.1 hypothetical protein BH583_08995 [Vibrio lentus]
MDFKVLTIEPAAGESAAKRFFMGEGHVQSEAVVTVTKGKWKQHHITCLDDLLTVVDDSILCSGVLSNEAQAQYNAAGTLTVRTGDSQLDMFSLARNKREGNITYPDSQGFLLIDYDGEEPLNAGEIHARLCEICPNFIGAGYVAKPSSSAGVHLPDGSKKGADGWHLYYVVDQLAGIPDLAKELVKAAWCAGHGYIKVSAIGSMLERNNVLDVFAVDCSRLAFENSPVLSDGITRNPPTAYVVEGEILDTAFVSTASEGQYVMLVEDAKRKSAPEAQRKREQWCKAKVEELVTQGVSVEEATLRVEKVMTSLEDGVVSDDIILTVKVTPHMSYQRKGIKRGESYTLRELLDAADGQKHKITCYDAIHNVTDNLEIYPHSHTIRTYKYSSGKKWYVQSAERKEQRTNLINALGQGTTNKSASGEQPSQVTDKAATLSYDETWSLILHQHTAIYNMLMNIIPSILTPAELVSTRDAVYNLVPDALAKPLLAHWLKGTMLEEMSEKPERISRVGFPTLKNIAMDFNDHLDITSSSPLHVLRAGELAYPDLDLGSIGKNINDVTAYLAKKHKLLTSCKDRSAIVATAVCHALRKLVYLGGISKEILATYLMGKLPNTSREFLYAQLEFFINWQMNGVRQLMTINSPKHEWTPKIINNFEKVRFNADELTLREILFIRAPMASGKTQAMVAEANRLMSLGMRVVIITHRERLSTNNAVTYSQGRTVSSYEEYDRVVTDEQPIVVSYKDKWVVEAVNDPVKNQRINGLAICLNSAFTDKFEQYVMAADFVIIDEASQVLDAFTNKTMKGNGRAYMNRMVALMQQAPKVALLDAGLCARDIRQLVRFESSDNPIALIDPKDVTVFDMPPKTNAPTLKIVGTPTKLVQELSDQTQRIVDGDANSRFMLACDSVSHVWNLRRSFIEMGVDGKRILCISAENPKKIDVAYELKGVCTASQWKKDMANFTAQPDKYAELYDIVIYSPAIDSGISLVGGHFNRMFGWFTGVIPAPSTLQMLRRLRTVDESTVYLTTGTEQPPLDVSQQAVRDTNPIYRAIIAGRVERLNKLTALQASSMITAAQEMGFNVEALQDPQEVLNQAIGNVNYNGEEGEVLLVLRDPKELTDQYYNAVCEARDIGFENARSLMNTEECTNDDMMSCTKTFVRYANGLQLTDTVEPEHVKNFQNPSFRKAVYHVELISGYRKAEHPSMDDVRAPELKKREMDRGLMLCQIDGMINRGLATEAKRLKKVSKKTKKNERYYLHHSLPWIVAMVDYMWENKDELVALGVAPSRWGRPSTTKPEGDQITKTVAGVMKSIGHVMSRSKMNADEFDAWVQADYDTECAENVAGKANNINNNRHSCDKNAANNGRVDVNQVKTMNNQRHLMTIAVARKNQRVKENRDFDGYDLTRVDVQIRQYSTLDELKALRAEQSVHDAERGMREARGQKYVYLLPTLVKPADVDLSKRAGDVGKGSENVAYTDIEAHAVNASMFQQR